jgi:tetratricopeptide (TPR) repeat protein
LVSGWEKDIPPTQITGQVTGRIADISSEYLENLANEINDPAILKELATAHLELGHRYAWALVNEDKAKASFQKAETISRRLIADNPYDVEAKDLLVRSLGKYDEFFGYGDREESLRNHFERLRIREEIYAVKPNDEKALGDLANATHNCGWVLKLLRRRDEALPYFQRSIELYQQLKDLLEPNAVTIKDRQKISNLYSLVAMNQSEDLGDLTAGLENYRRAANIADAVYLENPDDSALQKTSTQFDLGFILKKNGNFRASNDAFRTALEVAQNYDASSPNNGYIVRKEIECLIEVAENFNLLGDDKSALKSLRESFAVRRKSDEIEVNKDTLQNYSFHGFLYFVGGKLLMRMRKFDEARAAFEESETYYKKLFETNPNDAPDRLILANLYLTMGDLYAESGVCSFENSPFLGIASQKEYCPSETKGVPTTNRNRLTKAKKYYEDALNILTAMDAKNLLLFGDKENLRIAQEKVELCNEELKGKS